MWRCLNCKHLVHSPFIYYGGMTGWDAESLRCSKDHFWLSNMEIDEIRKANGTGEVCPDFETIT